MSFKTSKLLEFKRARVENGMEGSTGSLAVNAPVGFLTNHSNIQTIDKIIMVSIHQSYEFASLVVKNPITIPGLSICCEFNVNFASFLLIFLLVVLSNMSIGVLFFI